MKIISSQENENLARMIVEELRAERETHAHAVVCSVLKALDIKNETLFVERRQGKIFIVSSDNDVYVIVTLSEAMKMVLFFLFRCRSLMFPIVEDVDLE